MNPLTTTTLLAITIGLAHALTKDELPRLNRLFAALGPSEEEEGMQRLVKFFKGRNASGVVNERHPKWGISPFGMAVALNNTDAIQFPIAHGADVNMQLKEGDT